MDKKEYQDKVVIDVKNMIIANDFMSYGEKKNFKIFLAHLNNDDDFEEAVGTLLRALHNLTKPKNTILSPEGEKLFKDLSRNYKPSPERKYYSRARLSNLEWLVTLIIFIVILILLFTGKLDPILSFLNKL